MVSKAIWGRLLKRDGRCWHCGLDDDTLIPQHRINRGMGGSKLLNRASNLIVLCSAANVLMESDSIFRARALFYGWKLERMSVADEMPVYDLGRAEWFLIDDDFNRVSYRMKGNDGTL